jgi:Zn-dependent oligopeptidase
MINVLQDFSDLSKKRLDALMADYIVRTKALESYILGLTNLTWQTLIQPYLDYTDVFAFKSITLMKDLHPDKTVRNNVANFHSDFINQIQLLHNNDVRAVFKRYATTQYLVEESTLTPEQVNFFNKHSDFLSWVDDGKFDMDGMNKLSIEINTLNCKINEHYMTSYPNTQFTQEELDYGSSNISYIKKRHIRKIVREEWQDHKSAMIPTMERVAFARQEQATLQGFTQHSDVALCGTMIKTTQALNIFLDTAYIMLKPYIDRDMSILRNYAKADGIDELQDYDIPYYLRIHKDKLTHLSLNCEKKYFPYHRTVQNILHLFEVFLGYTFTEIYNKKLVWHKSVRLLEVKENGTTKGYVYLDIVQRLGKQSDIFCHLAVVEKSLHTLPVSIVDCSFDGGYLSFSNIKTLFHELGHAMHNISSTATISLMSSVFCETDFIEAPSQFFEYWCCSPTILKCISPGIPDDIITGILKNAKLMKGYVWGLDLVHCKMDMAFHSKEFKVYIYALAYNIYDKILGGGLSDKNLYVECQPMFSGYDVQYYRYMYSLSIALELLSVFEGRELDPVLGKRFRDEILSQGALRPSLESVVKFLGREPDMMAFLKIVQ